MYPKKLKLATDIEQKLHSYLQTEIINHNGERGPYLEEIEVYQELYWAKPLASSGSGPIQGGSNLIVPLIAISVEAMHARNMTTAFALDDFTQIKLPDAWADCDKGLEKLLDHESLVVGQLYEFADSALLCGTKLGTGVGKVGYERIVRTAVKEVNGTRNYVDVVTKQGVTIDPVANANFIMPYAYQDEQTAPWCGEEHEDSLFGIKQKEDSGLFEKGTYEKLLNYYTPMAPQSLGQEVKRNQETLENKTPYLPKTIRYYEFWMTFNVDDNVNGSQRELVVFYHYYANYIMAVYDNWNDDLHRPYRHYNHFKVEHRWTGMGLCKMLDQFQLELTTQHRQTIDNGTLVNLRMFKVKKMSGLSPNEQLFPGKIWYVDEMDDVESFQLGEVYPSGYNNQQSALLLAQQRSGINELTLGMPSTGTPGTASGDLTRVQESNRRFDYTYKNIRKFLSQIQLDVLCTIKQFGVRSASIYDNIPNGDRVKSFIQTVSMADLRDQVVLDVAIAGQNQNKLLDRSSWTQLGGLITQYYTNMLQIAQQTGDQKLMEIGNVKAVMAGSEAMKQILESFDVRNINQIIITPDDLKRAGLDTSAILGIGSINDPSNPINQNGLTGTNIAGANSGASGIIQAPGMGVTAPIDSTSGGTGV